MKTLLLSLMLLFTLGCQHQAKAPKQTLRINITADPISFDPRKGGDACSSSVLLFLFDGLYELGKQGPVPNLAKKTEISDDKCIYIFTLKESFWSNGDLVSAYDFAHSWKKMLDPHFETLFAYELFPIKNAKKAKDGLISINKVGIEALDEKRLKVTLEHPVPYFLELLTHVIFYPVHHKLDSKNDDQWAIPSKNMYVTNGPFLLEQYEDNHKIILKKNPNYHNSKEIKLEHILISIVQSATTEFDLFAKGELDWTGFPMSSLPYEMVNNGQKQFQLYSLCSPSVAFMAFNTKTHLLSNTHLRKALTLAIDRKDIIHALEMTEEEIATSFLPPKIQLQKEPYFKNCDLPKANEHLLIGLQELGIEKKEIENIKLCFATTEKSDKIAQIVQQQWKKHLGLDIQLKRYEWKVLLDEMGTESVPVFLVTWIAFFNDPIYNLELFKDKDNSLNSTRWYSSTYETLINMSDYCKDPQKRKMILHIAEQKLMDAMPICPLHYGRDYYFKNPHLKGVEFSPMDDVIFKRAYFE
jgi:oligopeptide transport system substrate-binding protein